MIPKDANAHCPALLLLSLMGQHRSLLRSPLNASSLRHFLLMSPVLSSVTHSHSALSSVFCSIHLKQEFLLLCLTFPPDLEFHKRKTKSGLSQQLCSKESACNVGDPGQGRSPGRGNGNLLQYSCLESPMDRRAWESTVYSPQGYRVGHN